MKLTSPTVEGAKVASQLRKRIGGRLPQPVGTDGRTPALWAECTGYVVDDDPAATEDDRDVPTAIAAAPRKLTPADDTWAKAKARLATEVARAKADREKKPPAIRR